MPTRFRPHTILFPAALAVMPTALLADPPADNAPKLSQIVATVEAQVGDDLRYIDSIEWDRSGHWEVEYITRDGREVEVDVDPTTGRPVTPK